MKFLFQLLVLVSFVLISCSSDNTTNPSDPQAYTTANGIKGGMLYDKFWSTESGYDQTNPNIAKYNASGDFFRCKQCHAWDLLGTNGSYNGRGPKTNRPNVAGNNLRTFAQSSTPQALFDAIKTGSVTRRDISSDLSTYDPATNSTIGDQMPNYSQLLTDAQIWDIVKFLKAEAFDVSQLYDASYTGTYPTGKVTYSNHGKDGDATLGNTFYTTKCAACHGTDGKQVPDLDGTAGMTAGKFTRSKPNEVQHKVKFGQLGSIMIATPITLNEMKNLYKALADTVKFPN
ncbi:MAG: hypothetical protein A2X61_13590 [Ignavibacteria bacterium GWB2_35_12]|nr:MAG: hypothetical protein A2X61_13590 [Ignavibacteria bacterium GWB2_35_12]OGU95208.1 MAG: hypothetical protein A2220_00320 [Ignavibacteria bacterium RIFOXYA2_FULL_35_10]OGV24500.1 MAG: hypothetical protein A2475_15455 [Ignavibacteria bacterium RIFOXYC2_FULL_35_21]